MPPGIRRRGAGSAWSSSTAVKPDEALVHGQEAVRLQPDLAIHHHNLGNVLQRLNRWDEARAAYLEALRLDPDLAHSHLQIGMTLRADGQLAEAEPWFKQAVDLDPENAWFWEQLADLQMERQEHAAAISCWERAIELSANERAAPYISLGWSLQEEGRLAEAAESYRTAMRLQPEAVMAQINLGAIHEELGETAAAEAAYRTAIRILPNFGLGHARLGNSVACPIARSRPRCPGGAFGRSRDEPVGPGPAALCLVHGS